jgi:hypothetical protein
MLGYQLVILWLFLFFAIFYPLVRGFSIPNATIAYWCLVMLFIAVFEFLLPFNYEYMCKKGHEYHKDRTCFGLEDGKSLTDMLSPKMYMDLYADYSLSDCKYRKGFGHDGFHFVLFGELWHGAFSAIGSILTLYYLYTDPGSKRFFLSAFSTGLVQLTMIIWYVSPVFLELFIEDSGNHISKWWWPPFLWNAPWFVLPPLLIFWGAKGILDPSVSKTSQ